MLLYLPTSVVGILPGLNGDPSPIPEERASVVSPKTTPTDTDTDLSIWGGNFMKRINVRMQNQKQQLNGQRFPSSLIFLVLFPVSWPNNTSHALWTVCPSFRQSVSISGVGAWKDKHFHACGLASAAPELMWPWSFWVCDIAAVESSFLSLRPFLRPPIPHPLYPPSPPLSVLDSRGNLWTWWDVLDVLTCVSERKASHALLFLPYLYRLSTCLTHCVVVFFWFSFFWGV